MTPALVILSYAIAAILAFGALYLFHSRRWYWHAAAVGIALAIGLKPIPPEWNKPEIDVAIGAMLVFLVLWGVFAPLFRDHHTGYHKPA